MENKILNTIKEHRLFENKENVVVGVSGGPDSVCLLHFLYVHREMLGIRLHVVHINHMLRPIEAVEEEDYVRSLCDKVNVPLTVLNIDVKSISVENKISLEEAGRKARYLNFEKVAKGLENSCICVAHNKNDQAETILMHIIRGAGLEGLVGMEYKRDEIVRPLLDVNRSEIEEYCMKNSLNPKHDSSNFKDIFTRNRIRLNLIPYMEKLFGINAVECINRMSHIIKEDSKYINEKTLEVYKYCMTEQKGKICLDIDKIMGVHQAIIKRVIRKSIKDVKGNLDSIESKHIDDVIAFINNNKIGKQLHLPHGIKIYRDYNTLEIKNTNVLDFQEKKIEFDVSLLIPGTKKIDELGMIVDILIEDIIDTNIYGKINDNSYIQYFDYEAINGGISLRVRRAGDTFKPLNYRGTKKLKEYFIDNKISKSIRDEIPLLTMGKDVIWIIGYKISDKYKVTENTKKVISINCKYVAEKQY